MVAHSCQTHSELVYFLFPWEHFNSFHALNDNVLAMLASLVVQYVTAPSIPPAGVRSLYIFNHVSYVLVDCVYRVVCAAVYDCVWLCVCLFVCLFVCILSCIVCVCVSVSVCAR